MTTTVCVTCYVQAGWLLTYDTAEVVRRATSAERDESASAGDTGAFRAPFPCE